MYIAMISKNAQASAARTAGWRNSRSSTSGAGLPRSCWTLHTASRVTPQASRAMTRGEPQPQPDPSARPIMTATSATANNTEPVQSSFPALPACAADGMTAATASRANAQTIVPNQYAPLRPQD